MRPLALVFAVATALFAAAARGEVLPNGIRLPTPWPPRLAAFPMSVDTDPVPPPYLQVPPAVIVIDVGRQLFVDDFLIASTTLERSFHLGRPHPASPVLKPDRPWERTSSTQQGAMVFSDGVWYDPTDHIFKMWYMAGYNDATAYATSPDGLSWNKPLLDVQPGTNIVHPGARDSNTVWLDLEEPDPERRYKMFRVIPGVGTRSWRNATMAIHASGDGIHWRDVARSSKVGDRTTVFWNPFRKVWVYSIKDFQPLPPLVPPLASKDVRRRLYREDRDAFAAARWDMEDLVPWVDVDRLDPQRPELKIPPELYNLDAVAYESLIVGLFTIWRGQPDNRQKPNDVVLGYSRDGWNWWRPDRRAFAPVSDKQGEWNANNVQSAGGGFLVVGDQLYFYVSGRAGEPGNKNAGASGTGLLTLRRDGFASMDAGPAGGTLTTRPLRFSGKNLFVNVDAPDGELRVEALDERDRVIAPFTSGNCTPVRADATRHAVTWKGARDLARLAGKPTKLRFHLESGKLYSFWVSPDATGASHGYVAAGGPGFTGPTDTVGSRTDP